MKQKATAFDKHFDAREVASYGLMEAAHYLRIPRTTIRDWVSGRHYRSITGVRFSKPIIQVPDPDMKLLSFMNLVEIHVLDAIRRKRVARAQETISLHPFRYPNHLLRGVAKAALDCAHRTTFIHLKLPQTKAPPN